MLEAAVPELIAWQNFYVIIGSASAALTGLMFVVVTLIASRGRRSSEGIGAFGTPTVVHLCAALLIAAILSAPWPALWMADLLLGICGVAGVFYMIVVFRRARRQSDYQPVLEDWLFHTIFPFLCYAALVVAAPLMMSHASPALFAIASATVLFLFIGIHNAWDTITYMTFTSHQSENERQE